MMKRLQVIIFTFFSFSHCCFAEDTFRVGVMLCLTGDCAEWGTNGLRGVELAAAELNQRGGVLGKKVELVIEDSRDTVPSYSVSAFKKLNERNDIRLIIGPTWTAGGMPIAPLIAKSTDKIVISPSLGVKEFNETSENIFNTWPHDEVATRALANHALKQGWKKAAILGSQDPFYMTQTKIFEEEFARGGGEIVAKEEPLPDARVFKAEVMRIKAAQPDFVILTNYQADAIAKDLASVKVAKPILAIQMEKDRVKSATGALEGATFAMYEKPNENFQSSFKAKFNAESGISSDTAYDALMVYAQAVETVGTVESAKVGETMRTIKNFQGASGTFSIDDKGAVNKKPVLWQVKGLDYEKVAG